jgi:hypothetical protein
VPTGFLGSFVVPVIVLLSVAAKTTRRFRMLKILLATTSLACAALLLPIGNSIGPVTFVGSAGISLADAAQKKKEPVVKEEEGDDDCDDEEGPDDGTDGADEGPDDGTDDGADGAEGAEGDDDC